jgi:hypothetical protein
MAKRRKNPNYEEREVIIYHEVGEHEFELTAQVEMEFVPREPDVGIFQSSWQAGSVLELKADEGGGPFPLPQKEEEKLFEEILEHAYEDANNEEPDEPDYPED